MLTYNKAELEAALKEAEESEAARLKAIPVEYAARVKAFRKGIKAELRTALYRFDQECKGGLPLDRRDRNSMPDAIWRRNFDGLRPPIMESCDTWRLRAIRQCIARLACAHADKAGNVRIKDHDHIRQFTRGTVQHVIRVRRLPSNAVPATPCPPSSIEEPARDAG